MSKRRRDGKFPKGVSGNPAGRPRKNVYHPGLTIGERADNWQNLYTGMGTSRDKSTHTTHCTDLVPASAGMDLWRGNDLAARVIELYPGAMLRQGFRFCSGKKAIDEKIMTAWEELNLKGLLEQGLCYENAYSGAALLLGAIDGSASWTLPLKVDKIREFKWMTLLEPRELHPVKWYTDPLSPKFGDPELWSISPTGPGGGGGKSVFVHESRLVIFPGIKVTRQHVSEYSGFGDSLLTRVYRILKKFDVSWDSAGSMLDDYSQAILKLQGLQNVLASADGKQKFLNRMEAMDMGRSLHRMMVVDKDDDFVRSTMSLAGVADILDRFAARFAAAIDAPVTLIMGESPGGLNATGDSDISFFDDRVKSKQEKRLLPMIEYITTLMFAPLGVKEPKDWHIKFNPLRQLSHKEEADARKVQAEIDAIYITNDVYSPEEVCLARFGGDEFSYETPIDFKARAALEPPVDSTPDKQEGKERDSELHEQTVNAGADPAKDETNPASSDKESAEGTRGRD